MVRRVRLLRNSFINASYCEAGETVTIGDDVALAPHMILVPDDPPAEPQPNAVTVHFHKSAHEIDIAVNGVEMHVDHAALKVEVD